jgi:hypothetical protein
MAVLAGNWNLLRINRDCIKIQRTDIKLLRKINWRSTRLANLIQNIEFEALTSVITKSTASCSLLKVNRRFGETYRLYLQGLIMD